MRAFISYSLLLFTLVTISLAQETLVPSQTDTTIQPAAQAETASDVDTIIVYQAKFIMNDVESRKSYFVGDAMVNYKNMTLKAGKITIDWDSSTLTAEGLPDSAWVKNETGTDSTRQLVMRHEPLLIDGDSQMTGAMMIYNYKTEKGRVVRGRTKFEDGHYLGSQIKMVGDKTFNVTNSTFTTCDLDSNPHFCFHAAKLKMIVNERVIAKPIVMYLGHIPVAALPFAFFPLKKGRSSGIIIPRYGESTSEGRYLRGLGYYWAASDYFDARATVDFFEKSGWLFDAGANYAIRYLLNGSINGSWTRKDFASGTQSRRWDVTFRHNHEIDPSSRFSASGTFVSDKSYYRDFSANLDTRLQRQLRSNATYSKYWSEQKISLSANFSQTRDLSDDVTQTTLPQISLRKSQTQLFKPARGGRSRRESHWYSNLYFSWGSNYINSQREYLQRTALDTIKKIDRNRQLNNDLSFSLNSPKKYFNILAVNHSLSIDQDWYDKTFSYAVNPANGQIESQEKKGPAARHTFSYSASANTKLYGVFYPGIADIQAIRHVVTPSLSFSYRPDFSGSSWGYFVDIKDSTGKTYKKDRFGGTTPSGGSQLLNLSVRNLFQMKRGQGEKTKKIDLFSMDFNTGYNFEADQYRLSDLRSSWQANPARNFSLSAGTSHSFYAWDPEKKTRVNRYLFEEDGWKKGDFMRLTSLNLSFSLRLEGKGESKDKGASGQDSSGIGSDSLRWSDDLSVEEEALLRQGRRFADDRLMGHASIPWRVNFMFNFYLDKSNPDKPSKRYYLDISGAELNLTEKWRVGYSSHIDIEKRQISYHRFTFYRDLHCWEASVDWVPSGMGKRVFFRINVKSPSLRDIKLERFGGAGSVLGY